MQLCSELSSLPVPADCYGQVRVKSGRWLALGVWDTAGAERFEALSRLYYTGSAAAIICFECTQRHSFLRAQAWVRVWHCLPQTAPAVLVHSSACLHHICHAGNLLTRLQVVELKVQVPQCRIFLAITKCDRLEDPPTFSSLAAASAQAQPAPGEQSRSQPSPL